MTRDLTPYPRVPWLRQIPAHWEVLRQRNAIPMLVSNIDKHTIDGEIPVLPEQTAIVRHLDHVDRRSRRYIQAKRRLIALLNEQKQAIIVEGSRLIDILYTHIYTGDITGWEASRRNADECTADR
jgi:hypothetical protein